MAYGDVLRLYLLDDLCLVFVEVDGDRDGRAVGYGSLMSRVGFGSCSTGWVGQLVEEVIQPLVFAGWLGPVVWFWVAAVPAENVVLTTRPRVTMAAIVARSGGRRRRGARVVTLGFRGGP